MKVYFNFILILNQKNQNIDYIDIVSIMYAKLQNIF